MVAPKQMQGHHEFGLLYQQHHAWLYAWLKKRLGDQSDAADIAQETFVRLIQKQADYQHYQPRALLTTIAKNLANSLWQRKKIEQAYYKVLQTSELHYAPSAEQEIIAIQTLSELLNVLDKLTPREKQVFFLSQIEGYHYVQIATELNISLITVKRDIKQVMLLCLMHIQLD
jgi:RNA polymerase sigma factor (sigma-70 family)